MVYRKDFKERGIGRILSYLWSVLFLYLHLLFLVVGVQIAKLFNCKVIATGGKSPAVMMLAGALISTI
jgi:hypothetical protein